MKRILIFCAALFLIASASSNRIADAQIAAGGSFTITQSAIASGGGQNSSGGVFALDGTIGQSVAGSGGQAAPFALYGGFWTPTFAPTAAMVSVGGRVRMANGKGIMNVSIALTDASGATRTTRSGAFGRYRFDDVPAGQTFILTATARRFAFENPAQIVSVNEALDNLDFIALDSYQIEQ